MKYANSHIYSADCGGRRLTEYSEGKNVTAVMDLRLMMGGDVTSIRHLSKSLQFENNFDYYHFTSNHFIHTQNIKVRTKFKQLLGQVKTINVVRILREF